MNQSQDLSRKLIITICHATIHDLLVYNARRITEYRKLPYLVVLNPLILESYKLYLESMVSLVNVSAKIPESVEENVTFSEIILNEFIEMHSDLLPSISKGFSEVSHLMSAKHIQLFLDKHLKEQIGMRLVAQQHIQLTQALSSSHFQPGNKYYGVIKPLNIVDIIKKNADMVNDMFLLKFDMTVPIKIELNLGDTSFWSNGSECSPQMEDQLPQIEFPYLDYHLDYILTEIFKNAFRSHVENQVREPVVVTVSTSKIPQFLGLRIRDKGKGISREVLKHILDYSFTTFKSNEGDSFKTLNVPPGLAGNTVAGMGYGLPLLKSYIEIFNDSFDNESRAVKMKGLLAIQTYPGWGTDIYLKIVGS